MNWLKKSSLNQQCAAHTSKRPRSHNAGSPKHTATLFRARLDGLTAELRDKMRAVGMGTWAHLRRSPDRQCPGDLSKPGQHYTIRTNDDLVSLELRWPETENMTRRLYILLHATTTGLAHSVFKNMVMDGSLSWLKLRPRVRRQTWHCPHSGIPATHEPRALHDQGGGTATPEFEDKCMSTRPDTTPSWTPSVR